MKPCVKCAAVNRYADGACKPCKKERARKYRKANSDRLSDYFRKYYENNKEKLKENNRNYYEANCEKVAKRTSNWRKENSEANAGYQRKHYEANPDKAKVKTQNRRSRIEGNGGRLSKDIVQTLIVLQKGKCACCGENLSKGYHIDHIMPIALGGKNTDENVQLLTPKCNLSKGAKHPIDYMRVKGRLI